MAVGSDDSPAGSVSERPAVDYDNPYQPPNAWEMRTCLLAGPNHEYAEGGIHEVGIWDTGERNSLVVVLRAIFTW